MFSPEHPVSLKQSQWGLGTSCAAAASEAAASGAAVSDFDVPGCRFPAVAP